MTTTNDELLNFIIDNDMIDINDVQQQMNQKKKEEFVSQSHTYQIWQGTNGRWYTYLPDETRPKGRRQIAKSSRDLIIDTVYSFYNQKETQATMTLEKLYPAWLSYKSLHVASTGSIRRIDDDWKKYYLNDPIIKLPLTELNFLMLDEWAHKLVKDKSMTKTCYFNMSLIIRQTLLYAVEMKLLSVSPFANVKIESKLFSKTQKKPDSTQVFKGIEKDLFISEAMEDYKEKFCLAALAIAFVFQTGVRLGELVALRFSDINGNYLHVQRMEVKHQEQSSNGLWYPAKRIIVDHVKTDAGDRMIYLTTKALDIIALVKRQLKKKDFQMRILFFKIKMD